MGKGYKHGTSGGANPLNFTVKTYPSETELKEDKPKKNTIGIVPLATMTSWAFLVTEPTEPEVGMVWFGVGNSSPAEFNALVENTLQVYPITAKQYVSNEWKAIPVWSFNGEEWLGWITYLYNEGDECTDITGGWVASNKCLNSGHTGVAGAPTVTHNSDNITVVFSKSGWFSTAKTIDVTNYKTLKITGSFSVTVNGGLGVNFMLLPADAEYTGSAYRVAGVELTNGGTECSLDISNVTGAYLVGLASTDRAHTIVIHTVELL